MTDKIKSERRQRRIRRAGWAIMVAAAASQLAQYGAALAHAIHP